MALYASIGPLDHIYMVKMLRRYAQRAKDRGDEEGFLSWTQKADEYEQKNVIGETQIPKKPVFPKDPL